MPAKRAKFVALLGVIFTMSFLTVFLAIFFTQSAYSTPASYLLTIDDMEIMVGPPPNSTNVPLDTTITVDALASAALDDLQLVPEVPIARVYSVVTGPLTYLNTFYPGQVLKPETRYTVSVTIMRKPVEWSFVTTAEPFEPRVSFYLAGNSLWIALMVAAVSAIFAAFLLSRREQMKEDKRLSTQGLARVVVEDFLRNHSIKPIRDLNGRMG